MEVNMNRHIIRKYFNRTPLRDYVLITSGVFLYAFAGKNIYGSLGLVTGGLTGVSVILRRLFMIPQWITMIMLNVPLLLWALREKGCQFLTRTVYAILMQTLFLAVIPDISIVSDGDLILGALFGGILMGAGCGLVLTGMGTGGGTDLMAVLLQKRILRSMSVSQIIRILDWTVVVCGAGVFGLSSAMYAMISVYIMTKVSDALLSGPHMAKAMLIMSNAQEKVAGRLMKELDRGVTSIRARGMYLQKETEILYCVVSGREIAQAKDIVSECDPHAFVIILDAREVLGRGFSEEQLAVNPVQSILGESTV
jgi:uncharacterized membrane-anchored protein YitT (DUF2179 family)